MQATRKFEEVTDVIEEYFCEGHVEPVVSAKLNKPCKESFFVPMHTIFKVSSTNFYC